MLTLLFASIVLSTRDNNYAIIMSGSKVYNNYKHQADVYTWIILLGKRGYDNNNSISDPQPQTITNGVDWTKYLQNMFSREANNIMQTSQ